MATVVMYPPGLAHLDHLAVQLAHAACDEIIVDVRRDTPVLTGALRKSLRVEKNDDGGKVWIGTDHWMIIEYGAVPHTIRVHKPRRSLASDEGVLFGRKVNHPGVKARAMMRTNFYRYRYIRVSFVERVNA
jgi:hypothetical protein